VFGGSTTAASIQLCGSPRARKRKFCRSDRDRRQRCSLSLPCWRGLWRPEATLFRLVAPDVGPHPLHTVGSPRFRVVDADPCGSQQINWLLSRNFECSVVTIGRTWGGSGAAKCVGVRFRSFLLLYFFFCLPLSIIVALWVSRLSRSPEATRPLSVQHQQHTTAPHHRPAHTTRAPCRVAFIFSLPFC
jgi:hypothetical protein